MLSVNGQFQLNTAIPYGDKSISHRALILAAIADGTSVVRNVSLCEDVHATAECLRRLGAKIKFEGATATVTPIVLPKKTVTLDCRNSGTTARLLAGLVSGLGVSARFVGDESLSKRPMQRVIEPLSRLGARFEEKPDCLFVCHGGKLTGKTINSNVNSAQVKSAVLLAGLFADGETTYVEQIKTRNHTENLLQYLSCDIKVDNNSVTVRKSKVKAFDITVPNDPSSAAYFVALALGKNVELTLPNVLLSDTRMGFYHVLQKSGACISFENIHHSFGESVCDVAVKNSNLRPFHATATDVCDGIDEIPILATLALTVKGKHEFCGVAELKHKESNRLQAIEHIATVCGQQSVTNGDTLQIVSDGKIRKNAYFHSFNDHRIAMCEVIISLIAGGGSVDKAVFAVSLPQFEYILGIEPLRLGLIGQSVADSKSPQLMAHLSMNAGVTCSYDTFSLPCDATDSLLLKVANAFDGLNVTMPFKNRMATLLNASVQSVNTVGRRVEPTSTDGYGIVQSLLSHGIDFANKPLIVVGAGGAAEACVEQLLKYGCKIQLVNRTAQRKQQLQSKYNLPEKVDKPVGVLSFIPECDYEQQLELPCSAQFVLIADYKGASGLKRQAVERGVKVIDGLEMLYHQGAKSFALWTNTPVQNDYQAFFATFLN